MKSGEAMEAGTAERELYTLAQAYQDISAGTEPWVALNEFLHEWFEYAKDQRSQLIAERIPAGDSLEKREPALWRWAVFCAATADWLCEQGGVQRSTWADDPVYTLAAPWYCFDAPGIAKPHVRDQLKRVTPTPFRRRNIIYGDRIFVTKYAFAQTHRTQ